MPDKTRSITANIMFGFSMLDEEIARPLHRVSDDLIAAAIANYQSRLEESCQAAHDAGKDLAVSAPFFKDGNVCWLTKFLPPGLPAVPVGFQEAQAGNWRIFRTAGGNDGKR